MNRFKFGAMIFCLALVVLAFSAGAKADDWNKTTVVTFSEPFEVPGVGAQVLPAGTYVFKLLDHAIRPEHRSNLKRTPGSCIFNHPCDSKFPFAGDRQNGHDV